MSWFHECRAERLWKVQEETCLKLLCQQHHLSSPLTRRFVSYLSLKVTSKSNQWEALVTHLALGRNPRAGKYRSREDIHTAQRRSKKLAQHPCKLFLFMLCLNGKWPLSAGFLSMRFLSPLFDSESDIEETVCDRIMRGESLIMRQRGSLLWLHCDPAVVSQPPADRISSQNLHWTTRVETRVKTSNQQLKMPDVPDLRRAKDYDQTKVISICWKAADGNVNLRAMRYWRTLVSYHAPSFGLSCMTLCYSNTTFILAVLYGRKCQRALYPL